MADLTSRIEGLEARLAQAEAVRQQVEGLTGRVGAVEQQLAAGHADLYTPDGLRRLARHLRDGGVFALWSDDPPDDDFMVDLGTVFTTTEAQVVGFANPLTGGTSTNTVYVAR